MAIITTVSSYDFKQEFLNSSYSTKYSIDGLDALYDYLEQLSEDLGENIELDIVSIACEYTEYQDIEEFLEDHPRFNEYYNKEDEETTELFEKLSQYTEVIEVDNAMKTQNFIIRNF